MLNLHQKTDAQLAAQKVNFLLNKFTLSFKKGSSLIISIIIYAFLFVGFPAAAQDSLSIPVPAADTTRTDISQLILAKRDSVPIANVLPPLNIDSLRNMHSPRKAALYSAVLPGLGQAYNHQYLKIPLMYAGLGVATGIFVFNYKQFRIFRDAYRLRVNGKIVSDPQINIYSTETLKYARDLYRQYVDYSVLGFIGTYLYNIIDAVVFAHLYKFDVSNNLGFKFGPVMDSNQPLSLGITINLGGHSPKKFFNPTF